MEVEKLTRVRGYRISSEVIFKSRSGSLQDNAKTSHIYSTQGTLLILELLDFMCAH